MNQTDSIENIKQQTTSNVEKLNVETKKSTENKSSKKKKIIIAITIIILILIIVALIVYIILKKKDDDRNKFPIPETDISLNTTIIETEIISDDISDSSDFSDSNGAPKLSDSSISDIASTIYESDSYETYIIDTEDFPSESI